MTVRKAIVWTSFWIACALGVNAAVLMLLEHLYPIGTFTSLCVVISILTASVALSAVKNAVVKFEPLTNK